MVKKLNKIENEINLYIKRALSGKQTFYNNLQTAFEIFVANYNTALSGNSEPLLNILKASGKEITSFKEYVYKSTNITKLALSKKGGLLLTFDNVFKYDDEYIDSHKWFDELVKKDNNALKELDDKTLYATINKLLKRVKESNAITKKEYFIRNLELLSNSKQA